MKYDWRRKTSRLFEYKINKYNEVMILCSYKNANHCRVFFPFRNVHKSCTYNDFKNGSITSFPKYGYNKYNITNNYIQILCFDKYSKYKGYNIIDFDDYEKVKSYKWSMGTDGYLYTKVMKQRVYLSQFIMNTNNTVDHYNRDRFDCRRNNLKIVSRSQNNYNKSIQSNNTSGITGVCYSSRTQDYIAYINTNKTRFAMHFKTKIDACIYRRYLELKCYKDYHLHNNLCLFLKTHIKDEVLLNILEVSL